MKKRVLCLIMALLMCLAAVIVIGAYSKEQERSADALNELGLFLGNGVSYDLDSKLNRAEAVTLLIRMIGKEKEATTGNFTTPFKDVPNWAKGYVGYAYKNKITLGVSEDEFGSSQDMTDNMFLTLALRALGYSDTGAEPQFVWKTPYNFAKSIGIIDYSAADTNFTRGDAVVIFWNVLGAEFEDGSKTLAEDLINNGIFTSSKYEKASEIQKNGRKINPGVPVVPGDTEEVQDTTVYIPDETIVPEETTTAPEETTTVPEETTTAPEETTTIPEETTTVPEETTTVPEETTTVPEETTTVPEETTAGGITGGGASGNVGGSGAED